MTFDKSRVHTQFKIERSLTIAQAINRRPTVESPIIVNQGSFSHRPFFLCVVKPPNFTYLALYSENSRYFQGKQCQAILVFEKQLEFLYNKI